MMPGKCRPTLLACAPSRTHANAYLHYHVDARTFGNNRLVLRCTSTQKLVRVYICYMSSVFHSVAELELYSRLVMSLAMFFANSLNALALFI